jgi:hypothetical protein
MQKKRDAKERKRWERVKDEPLREDVRGKHVWTLTFHNRLTGQMHTLDAYICRTRANSLRVTVDGKPWREKTSKTAAVRNLSKAMPSFGVVRD